MASEFAQALEKAAAGTGGGLDNPVLPSRSALPTEPTRFRGEEAWRVRRLVRLGLTVAGVTAATLVLLVAASLLQHLQVEGDAPDMTLPPIAEVWHAPPIEAPDTGVSEEALLAVLKIPRSPSPAHVLSLPMPKTPFPGQKRPPCSRRFEREVLGACWSVLKGAPPCGRDGYEYNGECLKASFEDPRQPTSEQP